MNKTLILTIILCCGLASLADAAVVVLKDGAIQQGRLWLADGKVTVQAEDGTITTADKAQLVSFTSDDKLTLELDSGDRVVGTVRYDADIDRLIVTSSLGEIPVALGNVTRIMPGMPGQAPPVPGAKPADEDKPVKPDDEGFPPPKLSDLITKEGELANWTFSIQLGLTGETGNSEKVNFTSLLEANRKTDDDHLRLYAISRYGKEGGVNTTNEHIGGASYDRDIDEEWFWYVAGEVEHDQFEQLAIRARPTAGVGYHFIKQEHHNMNLRAGAGYLYEEYFNGNETSSPIAEVTFNYDIDIDTWVSYVHKTSYFPVLDDLKEFRATMYNAFEFPLVDDSGWKLAIGMRNSYNSEPQGDSEYLDTFYFVNLGFDF